MENILLYLVSGATIGSTLALLPSPLLALMVNETIKYGEKEGIKVALVPSLTDIPIISAAAFIMLKIDNMNQVLGVISVCGFIFLTYLGVKSFMTHGIKTGIKEIKPQSIKKGIITNFLNPNPYIFWFTVGAPSIVKGWDISPFVAFAYLAGFFSCLIGIRVVMSIAVGRSGKFINSKGYFLISKILSIVLIIFGIKLLIQGVVLFVN